MFNLLHPKRLINRGRSNSQQICEDAITQAGKNKGKELEHDIRCQEVQKPRHFIMGRYQLQRDTGDTGRRHALGVRVFLSSFISPIKN